MYVVVYSRLVMIDNFLKFDNYHISATNIFDYKTPGPGAIYLK